LSDDSTKKVLVGTSGWSYKDWVGPVYPEGTAARDYLGHYAGHFPVVEVDSTFYALPAKHVVKGWADRSPAGFRFALKVPSIVTHGSEDATPKLDKVLGNEHGELDLFLESASELGDKLGPVVFQFPYFRVKEMKPEDFLGRLEKTLRSLPADRRFAVEIRNKPWIRRDYLDLLRAHRVAAVFIDHPYFPPPRAQLELGMLTTDFTYVRLLGDRYAIEEKTKTWGQTIEDKSKRILEWSEVLTEIAKQQGIGAAWVFANNHFAGHAPATCRELLRNLGRG
jgi:uncharacterized protein YecE (DUF72 family)